MGEQPAAGAFNSVLQLNAINGERPALVLPRPALRPWAVSAWAAPASRRMLLVWWQDAEGRAGDGGWPGDAPRPSCPARLRMRPGAQLF